MSTPGLFQSGDEDLRELDFSTVIAANVVKQALRDLEVRQVKDINRKEDLQAIRDDAYDFLTRRLWDPECLWLDLLGHCLVRQQVLQEVAVRCSRSLQMGIKKS